MPEDGTAGASRGAVLASYGAARVLLTAARRETERDVVLRCREHVHREIRASPIVRTVYDFLAGEIPPLARG